MRNEKLIEQFQTDRYRPNECTLHPVLEFTRTLGILAAHGGTYALPHFFRLVPLMIVMVALGTPALACNSETNMDAIHDGTLAGQNMVDAGNWKGALQAYKPVIALLQQDLSEDGQCHAFAVSELKSDYDDAGVAARGLHQKQAAISYFEKSISMWTEYGSTGDDAAALARSNIQLERSRLSDAQRMH